MAAAAQLSLFGREEPDFDPTFATLERIELEEGAWIDVVRGWLCGHARLTCDLLVMGGSCQRTYQHAIPKVVHADPRIAIMYRPIWKDDGDDTAPRADR